MSRDDDALAKGNVFYGPTLLSKRKELRRSLDARVATGEITGDEARVELRKFEDLMFAHHREHGSEPKQ